MVVRDIGHNVDEIYIGVVTDLETEKRFVKVVARSFMVLQKLEIWRRNKFGRVRKLRI